MRSAASDRIQRAICIISPDILRAVPGLGPRGRAKRSRFYQAYQPCPILKARAKAGEPVTSPVPFRVFFRYTGKLMPRSSQIRTPYLVSYESDRKKGVEGK